MHFVLTILSLPLQILTRHVTAELLHGTPGDSHVFKHALQFGRKLATAFVLQLGNHVFLAIVGHTLIEQQSFG